MVALGRGGVLDIVEDGVHGLLVAAAGEGDVDALAEAIDKAGRIGFNALDLRSRAEAFSVPRFLDRFSTLLETRVSARKERSA